MSTRVWGLLVVVFLALTGGRALAQPHEGAPAGSGSAAEHAAPADEHAAGSGSASGEEHAAPAGSGAAEEHAAPADEHAAGSGSASGEEHAAGSGSAEEHPGGSGSAEEHAGEHPGSGEDHPVPPGSAEEHAGSGEHDHTTEPPAGASAAPAEDTGLDEPEGGTYKEEPIDQGGEVGTDGDGEPYMEYDEDGDGKMSPEEIADAKEYEEGFKEAAVPNHIDDAELDKREIGKQLIPSLSADMFRKLVHLAKRKVLAKMEAKMAAKQAKKMTQFFWIIVGVSLAGFLMLFAPLFLRKKYPGQDGVLVKYSGLAALTFFLTVNLFGAVLYGMKIAQGKASGTAPNIAIAGGFFDTLDDNAEKYITMGKELFAPTLEQLTSKSDEQPAVALIANGQKIVKDAMVFVRVAKMFKKIDFLFQLLPVILLLVTIILFVLAIKPTLVEIIKLPAAAASGQAGVGREVAARATKRVKGELLASLCALGVLFVMSIVSGFILGQVAKPALAAIIDYFSLGVDYLQFVHDASSTMVFVMLFSVIFFLVLNLLTLILSTAFFMGKTQKIFQAYFNDGVPLANHKRFWQWGIGSVFLVQLIPLVFVFIAKFGLEKINDSVLSGVTDASQVNWKMAMLAGPAFLIFGYLALFWAARGVKGIVFLQRYKVVPKPPKAAPAPDAAS